MVMNSNLKIQADSWWSEELANNQWMVYSYYPREGGNITAIHILAISGSCYDIKWVHACIKIYLENYDNHLILYHFLAENVTLRPV